MAYCLRCGENHPWWKFWMNHVCHQTQYIRPDQPSGGPRNVRVTELVQIDIPEKDDMLLIADVSDGESKKISLAQLKAFIRS